MSLGTKRSILLTAPNTILNASERWDKQCTKRSNGKNPGEEEKFARKFTNWRVLLSIVTHSKVIL